MAKEDSQLTATQVEYLTKESVVQARRLLSVLNKSWQLYERRLRSRLEK